jgi:dolichol kinase
MTFTTHLVVGATIGVYSPNFWVAGALGLLSHFVLDVIPHKDYSVLHKTKLYASAAADMLVGTLFFIPYVIWHTSKEKIFIAALFAVLPDLIESFYYYGPPKRHSFFFAFHNELHWFERNKKWQPSLTASLIYQILIVILCSFLTFFL